MRIYPSQNGALRDIHPMHGRIYEMCIFVIMIQMSIKTNGSVSFRKCNHICNECHARAQVCVCMVCVYTHIHARAHIHAYILKKFISSFSEMGYCRRFNVQSSKGKWVFMDTHWNMILKRISNYRNVYHINSSHSNNCHHCVTKLTPHLAYT